uniref:Uncharacterized protein n=1 Tax=Plectus sambesii TaxID=2011161 RepID=A0A914VRS7_9BILA
MVYAKRRRRLDLARRAPAGRVISGRLSTDDWTPCATIWAADSSRTVAGRVGRRPTVVGIGRQLAAVVERNERRTHGIASDERTLFVNYVNEIGQADASLVSIQRAVTKFGIPSWVVDVRHAATHTHLPALATLRETAKFCREWLWRHYWSLPIEVAVSRGMESKSTGQLVHEKRMLVEKIHAWLIRFETSRMKVMFKSTKMPSKSATLTLTTSLLHIKRFIVKHPEIFLNVFISEGHFIMNEVQLHEAKWRVDNEKCETVPSLLQEFWKPVFVTFRDTGAMPTFLRALIKRMSAPRLKAIELKQLCCWTQLMISAYGHSSGWSESQWKDILKVMLNAPQVFSLPLLNQVMDNVPSLGTKNRRELRKLATFSDDPERPLDDPSPDLASGQQRAGRLKTLQDLKKSLSQTAAKDVFVDANTADRDWVPTEPNDWRGVPLGLTPDQTAEALCLRLRSKTSLNHAHKALSDDLKRRSNSNSPSPSPFAKVPRFDQRVPVVSASNGADESILCLD